MKQNLDKQKIERTVIKFPVLCWQIKKCRV